MAAMMIEEPFREAPSMNITIEIIATLLPPEEASPQRVRAKVAREDMIIPSMKTGDLKGRKSVERPMRTFPKIAPTPKRLKIFADESFV